jgi:hypothetical protein
MYLPTKLPICFYVITIVIYYTQKEKEACRLYLYRPVQNLICTSENSYKNESMNCFMAHFNYDNMFSV